MGLAGQAIAAAVGRGAKAEGNALVDMRPAGKRMRGT